ncbi:MAG: glycosyltransferase family 4 protein, partial [Proteobacteria bacterium]|nr:glycosyltransferase family 4 protein [Pseudomonadota bacterium]
ALQHAGATVKLVVPWLWWKDRSPEEICGFYGVTPNFEIVRLPSWPPPERKFRLEKGFHGLSGPLYGLFSGSDLVHSRDLIPLMVAHSMRIPWSFETYRRHAAEKPWLPWLTRRLQLERAVGAVAHSIDSAEDLKTVGFPEEAVLLARPGHREESFNPPLSTATARKRCGIDVPGPMVGYVGNVGHAKGSDEILNLAKRLPKVSFLVVGGNPGQVQSTQKHLDQKGIRNVILAGHQKPATVADYLFAADYLYVPAIFNNTFAGSIFSLMPLQIIPGVPLKIYNYLAAGRPIVSAKQSITVELLTHEQNALLVPPNSMAASEAAIRRLMGEPDLAARLAANCLQDAATYTWRKRGEKMVTFFESRLSRINRKRV